MISLLFANPIFFFIAFGGLVFSLTIHEFAHAWVADRLGDPTPRNFGRVTLNPLAHLDPLGTLMLLVTSFGWGKPVPINPYNLNEPRRDSALVALAGPATNIVMACLLALVLRTGSLPEIVSVVGVQIFFINLALAIFNLLPIHPLDGSKLLLAVLPEEMAVEYEEMMHRYGMYILLALVFPWYNGSSPISLFISPIISFVSAVLLG